MTTSSLQFGPEWMRKAPAKPAAHGSNPHAAAAYNPSTAHSQSSASAARRNPSLGAMNGPTPVTSPPAAPSPGGFSFAAAAAGAGSHGAGTAAGSGTGAMGSAASAASAAGASTPAAPGSHPNGHAHLALSGGGPTSSATAAGQGNGGGTSGTLGSNGSLSLYSSKEGSRGSLSPGTENQADSLAALGAAQSKRKAHAERDVQRRTGSTEGASGALSPSLGSEPRGLNARGTSTSSTDRDRPGLFQRASSGTFGKGDLAAAASPTAPRERFSGIQGGVLSGVAPPERRRKESSEPRTPRHAPSEEGTLWERRGGAASATNATSEAFASAARFKSKPVLEGLGLSGSDVSNGGVSSSEAAKGSTPVPGSNATTPATPSWAGRRRDRAPGEGPIGPPADGSAGFGKFAGYERKRERMASQSQAADSWRSGSGTGLSNEDASADDGALDESLGSLDDEVKDSELQSGGTGADRVEEANDALQDVKLSQEAEYAQAREDPPREEQQASTPPASAWSAEQQQWLYRDPSGQVQGPFAATIMQEWYEQSYFHNDLMLRPQEQPEFHALVEFVAATGNNPKPFLLPPPVISHQPPPQAQPEFNPPPPGIPGLGGMRPDINSAFQPHHWDPHVAGAGAWPAPQHLAFGGPGGAMSPFGGAFGSPFATHAGLAGGGPELSLDAKLRQQEEYLAMIRQREMEEQQRQAAARGLSFGGQFGGLDAFGGWSAQPGGQSQPWGPAPDPVRHEGDISQQSPWVQPGETAAAIRSPARPEVPWGESMASHDTVQPIGTPIRSRSPLPDMTAPAAADESVSAPLNADAGAEVQPTEESEPAQQEGDATPELEANAPTDINEESKASTETAPSVSDAPQKEEEHTTSPPPEDPAPEQAWPQSPSAVEFAAEPDLEQLAAQEQVEAAARTIAERKGRSATKTPAVAVNTATRGTSAAGNVKVVGPDQFRKGTAGSRSASPSIQTPLSSLLPGGGSAGSTPTAAKIAPWAQQPDDTSSTGTAMSLREIQEAEAKQAEARRAAEKQRRAAAAAAAAATSGSDSRSTANLPTTMSWGLASIPSSAPRSQAGGAADANPTVSSTPQPAAWTASKAAPKKTLMEIQEEERKRAQAQQQLKANQMAAARKAYAESATRQAPSVAQPAPGWSVVGAGGKPTTPAPVFAPAPAPSAVASRPAGISAVNRTPSAATIPGVAGAWGASKDAIAGKGLPSRPLTGSSANGHVSGRSASSVVGGSVSSASAAGKSGTAATASTPAATPAAPTAPSPEFLRYFRDQLKGLNVKVESFLEMLLSFPLDPSPDVVELIAESIYANSSTLDGRRLAQDFVEKRKMDAGISDSRPSTSGASSGGGWSTSGVQANGGGSSSGGVGGGTGAAGSGGSGGGSGGTKSSLHGFQQVVKKGGKKRL